MTKVDEETVQQELDAAQEKKGSMGTRWQLYTTSTKLKSNDVNFDTMQIPGTEYRADIHPVSHPVEVGYRGPHLKF